MDYARLGSSGLLVSKIGLGTNNFGGRIDLDQTRTVIDRALEQGITLLDTADMYGMGKSEEFIGESLGHRRHAVVIATEFAVPMGESPYQRGTSRRYIIEAAEASLRRPKTDYIDLYQFHRPATWSSRARYAISASAISPAGRSSTPSGPRGPSTWRA